MLAGARIHLIEVRTKSGTIPCGAVGIGHGLQRLGPHDFQAYARQVDALRTGLFDGRRLLRKTIHPKGQLACRRRPACNELSGIFGIGQSIQGSPHYGLMNGPFFPHALMMIICMNAPRPIAGRFGNRRIPQLESRLES